MLSRDYRNGVNKKCKSTIWIQAGAAYPFKSLSPDIDYYLTLTFTVVERNTVEIRARLVHNRFPDYEMYVNGGALTYQYPTRYTAPGLWNLNVTTTHEETKRVHAITPECCP